MDWKRYYSSLCLLAGVALLAGCATTRMDESTVRDEVGEAMAQAEQDSAPKPADKPRVPDSVSRALIEGESRQQALLANEPRFDLAVSEVPARDFFMGLVEGTSYNMVVHPSVSGSITLKLKNVTVPEVMDVVREIYGYEYRLNDTAFMVMPSEPQTRIFHVNYLNIQRQGNSETWVSSGGLSESGNGEDGDSGSSSSDGNRTLIPSSRIRTATVTDFWGELRETLSLLTADDPEASVIVSPQSSLVMVRARPDTLRQVADYLETAQGVVQRQVILEAKIVEVTLNDGFQAGINWSALTTPGENSVGISQINGGSLQTGNYNTSVPGNPPPGNFSVINGNVQLPSGVTTTAIGGIFSMALRLGDFSAFLELLETQGDVNVLSSPRVSTVNNQKAMIKVGTEEFFLTDVSSSDSSNANTTTNTTQDITLTPFFSGIALDVTPQIDKDGGVTLHVHPAVSEVTDVRKEFIVAGEQQELPLAFSSVRESDSIIRAQSGQVVVIGGLMQTRMVDNRGSTPFLGDIPLVGSLFRHSSREARKSELVILLRPVVVDDNTFKNEIGAARQRMDAIREQAREKANAER